MTILGLFLSSTIPVEVSTPKYVHSRKKKAFRRGKYSDKLKVAVPSSKQKVKLSNQAEQEEVLEEVVVQQQTAAKSSRNPQPTLSGRPDVVDGRSSHLDFPFLNDPFTINFIKTSKTMFIMRGLSGAGKSTVVQRLQQLYAFAAICSADHYFLRDGEYQFDASLLGAAHSSCQHLAQQAAEAGCPVIVIDNTNVKRWEMKFYLSLAFRCSYVVIPVVPKTPWRFDPEELARRSKHGVDVELLRKKTAAFDEVMPLYYGWFLNERDSGDMLFMAHKLYAETLTVLPELQQALLEALGLVPDQLDQDAMKRALADYFGRSAERTNNHLHCTAKFLGRGRSCQPGAAAYNASPLVQQSCGHAFTLEVFALTITTHTLGARVRLQPPELQLYDKPEERDWRTPGGSGDPGYGQGQGGTAMGGERVVEVAFQDGAQPLWYAWRGRSAHLTLGCAQNVAPRETNFDVLRICDQELAARNRRDFIPLTLGRLLCYQNALACIYLYRPIHLQTLFSGQY